MDNLLWKEPDDLALLEAVKTVKRESRIARDNSEDALTWNVFRYLAESEQLPTWLASIAGLRLTHSEIVYWSYSQQARGVYPDLMQARSTFGETPQRSSEPDVICVSDQAVFWIEAKLNATNRTLPSNPAANVGYLNGGDRWYGRVFCQDYNTVAMREHKYELLRFWLLGTWMATQMRRDFFLINLVPASREKDIEPAFRKCLTANERRTFQRVTWESLYRFVSQETPANKERNQLLDYLRNKTIGYNHLGELRQAFHLCVV